MNDSALSRLFSGPRAAKGVVWFSLPGGRPLYSAGQPADTLYFVRAGRLGVVRKGPGDSQHFLGVIKPGEPAGEMALIAGTAHSATVIALRDSEILALSRAAFFAEARRHPDVMAELARLMILRARETQGGRSGAGEPTVFGLVGVAPGAQARDLAERVAEEITHLGFKPAVVGAEALHQSSDWFTRIEASHDVVLMAAEANELEWSRLCTRQVDRLFLIGRGDQTPPEGPCAAAAAASQLHRLMDLILIQPDHVEHPAGSEAWLDSARFMRLFQIKRSRKADIARLARVISGVSVGLALSGGGARAYAHVGVVRAFREAGQPIDFVSGASMGAIIAGGVALGWDDAEISHRVQDAFVSSNPLGDVAFPMVAMTRGLTVQRRLKQHFGDVEIADLWLPFFCTSSNLTTAEYYLHHRGRLRKALRASIALPGILPPVVMGDDVLVDGAVMCNLPTDIMRTWHRGPVVGVDVAVAEGLTALDVARPPSLLKWIASGEWRRGPPIVSILIRAATAPTARETTQAHEAADLLIVPEIEGVELRDWRAFDPAEAAGYAAARSALSKLDRPLMRLRRREAEDLMVHDLSAMGTE